MRAPLTPIKAFVHDATTMGDAGDSSAADDPRLSQWLLVAQAAERLAELRPGQRGAYVRMLEGRVLPVRLGRPTQIEGDGRIPVDADAELAERLRMEAEDMERAGCFELALSTVSSVCQILAKEPKKRLTARLLATAHMGRVIRQIGELGAAADCYTTVITEAQRAKDGPVAAHGFIGLGNVAHARGNRPSQKSFFHRALELAARGSPVELSAHQGLMVTANQQGELADALLHGWRAHDLALPESEVQLEIIANVANTAFCAGFFVAALSGFEFVIQRSSLTRNRLPAIGGGLRAAARAGEGARVLEIERIGYEDIKRSAAPYDVARFFFCAAEAKRILNDHSAVSPLVQASLSLADTYGFHELRIRAESLLTAAAPTAHVPAPETEFVVDASDPLVSSGISRLYALSGT